MGKAVELWLSIVTDPRATPDNTNADPDTRAQWIKLARLHDVPIRCVLLTSDARLCEHNDAVRGLGGTIVSHSTLSPLAGMSRFPEKLSFHRPNSVCVCQTFAPMH